GEGVLADAPQLIADQRIGTEIDLLFPRKAADSSHDLSDLLIQQSGAGGPRLYQQRTGTSRQVAHPGGHALHVLYRTQTATVEQLHRRNRLLLQYRYRTAAGLDIGEYQQGGSLVWVIRHSVIGYRADEAQSAFGADHQMRED